MFVDDQARYYAGAVAVGIVTAQIARGAPDGKAPAAGTTVVRSLPEVQAMFAVQPSAGTETSGITHAPPVRHQWSSAGARHRMKPLFQQVLTCWVRLSYGWEAEPGRRGAGRRAEGAARDAGRFSGPGRGRG